MNSRSGSALLALVLILRLVLLLAFSLIVYLFFMFGAAIRWIRDSEQRRIWALAVIGALVLAFAP
jgi:hypothetical protein